MIWFYRAGKSQGILDRFEKIWKGLEKPGNLKINGYKKER